jgi:hypothetical protein
MDIMELGAIGELVGGVAVVASLIFVGVQVRQNTKTLRRAGARQSAQQNQAVLRALADHSDVTADGWDRLDEMNAADLWRFEMVYSMWFQGIEQALADEREGLVTPEYLEPYRYDLRGLLASPGGERWWNMRKEWYTATLQSEVEKLREQAEVKPKEALSRHLDSRE